MVNRKFSRRLFYVSALAVAAFGLCTLQPSSGVAERFGDGDRDVARTSVHSTTINNVDVNHVNVDTHGCCYDSWGHPVATAAVATSAAIAVGSVAASLPPNCTTVVTNNVTYQNCGGVYYQPSYQGSTVQYQVVGQP